MSNKNKIAIFFEAIGLDKVIGSLSSFSKNLISTEKSTKQTAKATEELDDETKKLGSSLQKASSEINKTDTSTNNLSNANKETKTTTSLEALHHRFSNWSTNASKDSKGGLISKDNIFKFYKCLQIDNLLTIMLYII